MATMSPHDDFALDMVGISKRFGRTLVLDNVTFHVRKGTIHGLVGDNGAGKSTLMKIALGGVIPTEGTVAVGGVRLTYSRPAEARDAGVGMVLQELSLIPTLSVADNIFLNAEKTTLVGTIASRAERREARALLSELGITGVNPSQIVGELSIADQQMVEIAKAFRIGRRVLILDEPTAPLARQEIVTLFDLVRRAAGLGAAIIFITHHLREIFEVCEEVTVIREGRTVLSARTSDTSLGRVVAAIVGTELSAIESEAAEPPLSRQTPLLEVRDLSVKGKLADVSFNLLPGEILGIAGLAGSGRSTLLKALFGAVRFERGLISLRGKRFRPTGAGDAISHGVFLVPEDRHVHGVILEHTIEQNMVLPILRRVRQLLFYGPRTARSIVQRMLATLDVKATGPRQLVQELSGGNQQKVVFSKALVSMPNVFLLDEPTFGVDVHTAAEVIRRIRHEVEGGKAALWVSSDLEELLHVSSRILVLADGTIKKIVPRKDKEFTQDAIIQAIQRIGLARASGVGQGTG